jgi:hypothetical protein
MHLISDTVAFQLYGLHHKIMSMASMQHVSISDLPHRVRRVHSTLNERLVLSVPASCLHRRRLLVRCECAEPRIPRWVEFCFGYTAFRICRADRERGELRSRWLPANTLDVDPLSNPLHLVAVVLRDVLEIRHSRTGCPWHFLQHRVHALCHTWCSILGSWTRCSWWSPLLVVTIIVIVVTINVFTIFFAIIVDLRRTLGGVQQQTSAVGAAAAGAAAASAAAARAQRQQAQQQRAERLRRPARG